MAVEDVQYLLDNSVQDSALAFIDSSMRDRAFHPTPASYVVRFDEPYRQVFGFDVLDATIPNTMYNVDTHNNRLQLITVDVDNSSLLKPASAQTSSVKLLMQQLGNTPGFVAWAGQTAADVAVAVLDAVNWPASFPAAAASPVPVVATSTAPCGRALLRHTVPAVPITLELSGGPLKDSVPFTYNGERYSVPAGHPAAAAVLAADRGDFVLTPPPASAVSRGAATMLCDVSYFEARDLPADLVTLYEEGSLSPTAAGALPECLALLSICNFAIEPGNYVISTLNTELGNSLSRYGMATVSTTSSEVEKQGRLRFLAPGKNILLFNTAVSTAAELLGFSTLPALEKDLGYDVAPFGNAGVTSALFMSAPCAAYGGAQAIDAPGIVNLLGIRYVTLRCPEIEQHVNYANKTSRLGTGMGCFKLASTNELSQLRFDFVSLIRKPFHPIGKLTHMTLRFERSDGSLYDFKGVNHTMLMTIKYYSPSSRLRYTRSVLNPDYDPDYGAYANRQRHAAAAAARGDRGYADEADPSSADPDDVDDDDFGAAGAPQAPDASDAPQTSGHASEAFDWSLDFARARRGLTDEERRRIILEQRAHQHCEEDGCDSSSTASSWSSGGSSCDL
jgi:hypothetical protein